MRQGDTIPDTCITLIDFGVCKPAARIREHIGQTKILSLVFAVFPESLPGHHHRNGRLRDQVVAERAQQNTVKRSVFMRHEMEMNIPFQSTSTSRSKNYQCRVQKVDLSDVSVVPGDDYVSYVPLL
jgi:hypothetical protein